MKKFTIDQCRYIIDVALPDSEQTLFITKEVIESSNFLNHLQEFNDEYHDGELITEEDVYESIVENCHSDAYNGCIMAEIGNIYYIRDYLFSSSLSDIKERFAQFLFNDLNKNL